MGGRGDPDGRVKVPNYAQSWDVAVRVSPLTRFPPPFPKRQRFVAVPEIAGTYLGRAAGRDLVVTHSQGPHRLTSLNPTRSTELGCRCEACSALRVSPITPPGRLRRGHHVAQKVLPTSQFPIPISHFALPTSHFALCTMNFALRTYSAPSPCHFALRTLNFALDGFCKC